LSWGIRSVAAWQERLSWGKAERAGGWARGQTGVRSGRGEASGAGERVRRAACACLAVAVGDAVAGQREVEVVDAAEDREQEQS
jgi:hypothetical protein